MTYMNSEGKELLPID